MVPTAEKDTRMPPKEVKRLQDLADREPGYEKYPDDYGNVARRGTYVQTWVYNWYWRMAVTREAYQTHFFAGNWPQIPESALPTAAERAKLKRDMPDAYEFFCKKYEQHYFADQKSDVWKAFERQYESAVRQRTEEKQKNDAEYAPRRDRPPPGPPRPRGRRARCRTGREGASSRRLTRTTG